MVTVIRIEMSDAERQAVGRWADSKQGKRRGKGTRKATREEINDFVVEAADHELNMITSGKRDF